MDLKNKPEILDGLSSVIEECKESITVMWKSSDPLNDNIHGEINSKINLMKSTIKDLKQIYFKLDKAFQRGVNNDS